MNPIINLISNSWPLLMQGLSMTLFLWLTTAIIALSMGMLWGIMRSNAVRIKLLSGGLDVITFVLRGIPYYVQLLIAYFVFPAALGINLSACTAALLSLGFCSAAYISQMIRGSINTIPIGQWLAARALGYSTLQTIWYIILPQVLKALTPALTGELDQLLKSTSLVSSIGVLELTRAGMNIIARTMNPISVYTTIALMYLILSSLLAIAAQTINRRLS